MLKLSHVKKTFNKGTVTEKRALTGVDLTLNDGDFVTVIGGNGAGKSTLLNMIAGVYPLDSGVIELDGTDISRLSESQRAKYLGRVFQDPMRGTAADMQIAENLALAKRRGQHRGLSWGVTKAEKDEYVELLKRLDLGLDTRLNAKVGLLSGGQRQALTLLMATLTKPRLLLLDEHTAALDPKTASKVLNLTEEIVDEHHLTTLMVTHNMNDAIRLGNRLIMMHEGHVIYDVAGDEKISTRSRVARAGASRSWRACRRTCCATSTATPTRCCATPPAPVPCSCCTTRACRTPGARSCRRHAMSTSGSTATSTTMPSR